MYEQYYYMFLYLLRQLGQLLEAYWWKYVEIVHMYSVTAIAVLLSSILLLVAMSFRRKLRVTVIEGDAIHDLIRAMRNE